MPNILNQPGVTKVMICLTINRISLNVSEPSYTTFTTSSQAFLPQMVITGISLEHSLCTSFLRILGDSELNLAPTSEIFVLKYLEELKYVINWS